jgi:subtilisin family serine protease
MAKLQTAIAQTRDCLHRGVLSGLFLMLTACGGSGGGSAAAPPSPPVATASASVSHGQAPLTVNFDASKSTDPQNFPLTYSWAFSDGAIATGATPAHTFQNHGSYTATLAVNDGHNTTISTPIAISVNPAPPTVQPLTVQVNVMGVAATAVPTQLVASDRESLALTYSLTTPPTVGTATVNSSTGAISYAVPGYVTATTDSFTVTVANLGTSSPSTVKVSLNSDPLLTNQWHIQNVGQNAFATTLPVAGNDMNVTGAWTAGYSGKGIKVGVVDSGLEAAHEDLQANVDLSHSYNFLTGTNDPTPSAVGEDHGTQVAGIIGAVAFNGNGGRGVAYNATLRGYNLLAPTVPFSVANFAKAMGSDPVSADNDLFNASFESAQGFSLPPFSGVYQAITGTTLTLRANLGAAIVNAAGNDFIQLTGTPAHACDLANQFGVGCGDTAGDQRRGGFAPIIVAALNANGVHSSYSNTGSSLWISAPGGEGGFDSGYVPASLFALLLDPTHAVMPAITTTAHSGCANAMNPFNQATPVSINALDSVGANPLAGQCQYTALMNGTSSATPNTAGTVAMMLEANPKLSVRDIKYILAKTAKHVDPNFTGVASTNIISGSTITLEQGWVTNAAGFSFSNRYGFGGVDAAAAVAMAKTYTSFLPTLQNSTGNYAFTATTTADVVPPASATGATITYTVSEAFSSVEFVVVLVSLSSTPGMLCNQIELTSPSGTKSILVHAANGFQNTAVPLSRLESNAFYGEPANGAWKLRFLDFCAASGTSTTLSTTQAQIISIEGH